MKQTITINKRYQPRTGIIPVIMISLLLFAGLVSCKKYLDLKPDKALVVPATLADCQALLNYSSMNTSYPNTEWLADNYYLTYVDWLTLVTMTSENYIWKPNADNPANYWQSSYSVVLTTNQVLQTLSTISPSQDQVTWNNVKGQALFYRSFLFYMNAQTWAPPYNAATAGTDLGIPLRKTPSISEVAPRSTVEQTYSQIIQDLQTALPLLPATAPTSIIQKSAPCQASAYALLARVYLAMGDYVNAGINANSALQLYNTLMNYSTLNPSATFPIIQFNPEVLFDATAFTAFPQLDATKGKVDSNLYASYTGNDLRKTIFFQQNTGTAAGTYQFKGSYYGNKSRLPFCGLATDELFITRAECAARAGNASGAMADLNTLLQTRWVPGTYVTRTAITADDALAQVLVERRKELIWRSLRWTDLRRLNKDPRFAVTLSRNMNGTIYTLPPNDLRYTLLIPTGVIAVEPMPQNPR